MLTWILVMCVVWLKLCRECHGYYVGGVDGAGSCTYNFQVWSSDDNLVFKLEHLESKIVNASLHSDNRFLQIGNDILSIANRNQNITGFLDQEMLKYR